MLLEELIYIIIGLNCFMSGTGVLFFRNPVNAVISLIFLFANGAFLLAMHYVEFFAILYLLVYVGAIVIFFLFIVMLLDLKKLSGDYPNPFLYFFVVFFGLILLFFLFSPIFFLIDIKILVYDNFINFQNFFFTTLDYGSFSLSAPESLILVGFYLYTEYYGIVI